MKRPDALVLMRVAGYHGDRRRFTQLYIENRVSIEAARAEYERGEKMKAAGVPCTCSDCTKGTTT